MTSPMRRIVLASASPRRREILRQLGIEVDVRPSDADEDALEIADDVEFVREAALLKLRSVIDAGLPDGAPVLAADTSVCVGPERLGKPRDDRDALRMMTLLAGRDHVVRTAMALGIAGQGVRDVRVVETRVWFRSAQAVELERYVASGEGRDKAGAYGIQGLASGFVIRLEGSYTNVVGLPAAETIEMLLEHGALERWP